VWGICLVLICGFLAFAVPLTAPWWHILAIGFGIGAGFTLDEFALWVRLKDVYWSDEGRASFDAVVVAVAFAGLVVLGTTPFGLDDPGSIGGTAAVVLIVLGLSIVSLLKGRLFLGVLGLFIPVFGAVGALRLGEPTSIWARRRYSPERRQQAAGPLCARPARRALAPAPQRPHRRRAFRQRRRLSGAPRPAHHLAGGPPERDVWSSPGLVDI
jgi:hypothetical protein